MSPSSTSARLCHCAWLGMTAKAPQELMGVTNKFQGVGTFTDQNLYIVRIDCSLLITVAL